MAIIKLSQGGFMKRKFWAGLFAFCFMVPAISLGAACGKKEQEPEEYKTGINLAIQVDATNLNDAAKVQLGLGVEFVSDIYGKKLSTDTTFASVAEKESIEIDGACFEGLKDSTQGYELKDMIFYINIKNQDDSPVALTMTAETENQNLEFDCEQIGYIQEVANGKDVKTQVAAFRVMHKNNIEIEEFLADVNLKIELDSIGKLYPSEGVFSYEFDTENKTAKLTKYEDNTSGISLVVVPRFVENPDDQEGGFYTVTALANKVFHSKPTVETIYLPDTIEEIGDLCFAQMPALKKVYMSDQVKTVGRGFLAESTIEGDFYMPEEFVEFTGIPSSVESKPDAQQYTGIQAFYGCKNLAKVVFSEGIKKVPMGAFYGSTNLKKVILPTTINEFNAYENNGMRGSVTFALTGVEEVDFYNMDVDNLEGVQMFQACENLVSVYLPKPLKLLGQALFYKCTALKNVVLTNTLETIENSAFSYCSALETIEIPESVTKLASFAFNECAKLHTINLPSRLTEIGSWAFQNCKALKNVEIPETVEWIGNGAFNHCSGVENELIVLPDGIKQIGGETYDPQNPTQEIIGTHVFYDFAPRSIKAFEIAANNPYYMTIDGVLYRKKDGVATTLIAYPAAKEGEIFYMPDTVTDAYELSMSRAHKVKEVVLGDGFVIREIATTEDNSQRYLNADWANNLTAMMYVFNTVEKISVKETNPNYTSIDGAIYSKDLKTLYYQCMVTAEEGKTLTIREGVETIFFGAISTSNAKNNASDSQYISTLYAYSEVVIPASVKNIPAATVEHLNQGKWKISVAEGNTAFKAENNKLVAL